MEDTTYFDFAWVFDNIRYQRLIHKLKSCGIIGKILKWNEAFLSNRRQIVKCNEVKLDLATALSGIPQGSVLGQILFVIYINSIPEVMNTALIFLQLILKFFNKLPPKKAPFRCNQTQMASYVSRKKVSCGKFFKHKPHWKVHPSSTRVRTCLWTKILWRHPWWRAKIWLIHLGEGEESKRNGWDDSNRLFVSWRSSFQKTMHHLRKSTSGVWTSNIGTLHCVKYRNFLVWRFSGKAQFP